MEFHGSALRVYGADMRKKAAVVLGFKLHYIFMVLDTLGLCMFTFDSSEPKKKMSVTHPYMHYVFYFIRPLKIIFKATHLLATS